VVGTKVSLDGSLIKLQEKMNDMARREITKIIRGSILEINRPIKEISHVPSENQKAIWENNLSPCLTPYLNQIIPWPEVILPLPPESPYMIKSLRFSNESLPGSPSPTTTYHINTPKIFYTPTSPSLKTKRRRLSDPFEQTPTAQHSIINNENIPPFHFDKIFPKSPKEGALVTGSWVLSPQLMERNFDFSPFSPSNKRVKKTNGKDVIRFENPLPNLLSDLLQIKSMSPTISNERKKQKCISLI